MQTCDMCASPSHQPYDREMATVRVAGGTLHFEPVRIVGYRGAGVHRLALEYTARPHGLPQWTVLGVLGEVWLDRPAGGWLGAVSVEKPLVVRGEGEDIRYSLLLPITNDTIAAVEHGRGGGDVSLRVDQRVAAIAPSLDQYPAGDAQDTVRVAGAEWADILEQVGQALSVLVVVPLSTVSADSDRSLAARRLFEARTAMRDGRYRDAVAAARGALEILDRMSPPSSTRTHARDLDKDERFDELRRAVKNITNAAHHDDDLASGFTWTYADATAVIATAAALLHRLPDN